MSLPVRSPSTDRRMKRHTLAFTPMRPVMEADEPVSEAGDTAEHHSLPIRSWSTESAVSQASQQQEPVRVASELREGCDMLSVDNYPEDGAEVGRLEAMTEEEQVCYLLTSQMV